MDLVQSALRMLLLQMSEEKHLLKKKFNFKQLMKFAF